jgi:phosphoribosylanthranilate isomerase
MTLVKVCGVTSLEDARAAVEAGADALGFNLYPASPRYVSAGVARAIIEALPPDVVAIGVFVNAGPPEEVARVAEEAGFRFVQLHGDETPEYCARVGGGRVIKALRVNPAFEPDEAACYSTEAVLLDAYVEGERGGTGHTFDWGVARRVSEVVAHLYLAGGLRPSNVAEAVRAVKPFAVDVCSGVESAPGRKDAELMRRFVESVRRASAGA